MSADQIIQAFGNQTRIRACGIYIKENKILLIKLRALNKSKYFLSPPGGGVQLGESIISTLKREIKEETNAEATIGEFLFFTEYIQLPLHSIELYFKITSLDGNIEMGYDPELCKENQIIQTLDFYTIEQLKNQPKDALPIFIQKINKLDDLLVLKGFIK